MSSSAHARGRRWRVAVAAAAVLAALAVPRLASAAPASGPPDSGGPLPPTSLRVDGQGSDVLVGDGRPYFAWTVNDTERAEAQTAYEIRVNPTPATAAPHGARNSGWDSRKVSSADSTDAPYTGPALQSNSTYTWSVRTWNVQGKVSGWSDPASFDAGLFNAADWSAWWLQVDDGALVRGDIDIAKPVARARLYFGAQGIVEPHLNGSRVDPAEVLDSSDGYDVPGSGTGGAAGGAAGGLGAMLLVGTVITACIFGFVYQLFAAAL